MTREETILSDPCTSIWLHQALSAALARDPVDAVTDAVVLARVLQARAESLMAMPRSGGLGKASLEQSRSGRV